MDYLPRTGMHRTLALLMALALPTTSASPAPNDSGPRQLQALMQTLAGVRHIAAAFRDEKHSGILQFPLVTEGQFEYRAPDFIARRVSAPRTSLFEVDGDHIRLERDGEVSLIDARDQPMLTDLLRAILAIVGGDLTYLQSLFVIEVTVDEQRWSLRLKPTDPKLAQYMELLEVGGHGRRIETLSLHETNGDHTDTVFSAHRIR